MNDINLLEEVIYQRAYGQTHRDRQMLKRMKKHRESKGLSVEQVAEVMGAEPSQVARFESGAWNARQRFCREYAVAIGLEIHYMFKEAR